jgi:hypothetical protein
VVHLIRGGRAVEAGRTVEVVFNLTARSLPVPAPAGGSEVLFASEAKRYEGDRGEVGRLEELLPFECVAFGPHGWRKFS